MTYKVIEILFSDLQMAKSLENAFQSLSSEGFTVHSIHTTFSSVIVVAKTPDIDPIMYTGGR